METIQSLVEKSRAGHLDAFGSLVERFQDMAVGYAYTLLGDLDLAQDAAQEAFLQAYTNLHHLQDPAAFAGWFKKIVFSRCTHILRRGDQHEISLDTIVDLPSQAHGPAQTLEQKTIQAEVLRAIQKLPEDQRSVFILAVFQKQSYRRIAEFLDLSLPTVTNRLHQAKKNLQKELWSVVNESPVLGDPNSQRFLRQVLENVPWVGFYGDGTHCPEDIIFPAVFRACLSYLGEKNVWKEIVEYGQTWNLNCAAAFYAGVSGSAFRFSWDLTRWKLGWVDPTYMKLDGTQAFSRAFEAAGYDCKIWLTPEFAGQINYHGPLLNDPALARQAILESLAQKKPVIAIGVIGPAEPCILTGFEENGDVLIGWSHFQDEPDLAKDLELERCGYFRKRNGFSGLHGLIFFGERRPQPPLAQIIHQAIEWGVQLLEAPNAGELPLGWNSLHEWSEIFRLDELFNREDSPAWKMKPAFWEFAERRWYAKWFLRLVVEDFPAAGPAGLETAIDCFQTEHDLMWEIICLFDLKDEDPAPKFRSSENRRRAADLLDTIRAKDIDAAQAMRRALSVMPFNS